MSNLDEILEMIRGSGLEITYCNQCVFLTEENILNLYPDLRSVSKQPLWCIVRDHLRSSTCCAGIVEGDDAIERLLDISGRHLNPGLCLGGTIRKEYGAQEPIRSPGGIVYYPNAIHRSATLEEALANHELIFSFP